MTKAKSLKVKSILLITTLVLLVLGGVGIGLTILAQGKAGQKQTLAKAEKAEQLADLAVDASKASNLEALKTSQQQLKVAVALLEEIAPSAGLAYQRSQTNLAEVRSRLDVVEQRLQIEEAAFATLKDAKNLAKQATDISKNPPHSAAVWRTAQAQWQSAIKLVEKFPADTFASIEAKQNLFAYRANYSTVSKNIKTEEAALATLQKAQALATPDSNIGTNAPEATDLRKGQEKLLKAIELLQTIPPNTAAYASVKENVAIYVNYSNLIARLSRINNQLQEQQKQLKLFVFESSWVDLTFERKAQLRTLKAQSKGDRAKFIRECAARYRDRKTTTELSSKSPELSSVNSFYNELCGYMWARL